jgi:hypothetical protein
MSAVVRAILCVSGGQDYWPDEQRDNPDRILQAVIDRDYRAIVRNRDDSGAARYERLIWVNTKHLFPGPEPVTLPAHYVTLAAARHPLTFLPYQYEGYAPQWRAVLRSADTRMQLIGVLS